MIRLGVCSGACLTRDISGVIAAAAAARLDAVEWAADAHIGVGDLEAAESTMMSTLRAGLTTASYATLYRTGSEDDGFRRFDALLAIASRLQAPMMRVFACSSRRDGRAEAGILRLGDRAAKKGIMLCISMARGTSLGGYEQIAGLAEAARHEFIRLAWEDLPGSKPAEATAALVSAGRFAGLILARCAGRDGRPRAVAEDEGAWKERLIAFRRVEPDPKMGSFVLLCASRPEGAAGDESLAADARMLRSLVAQIG